MRSRSFLVLALAVPLLEAAPASAARDWFADDPPLLTLGTGAAQVLDSHQELFWGIEYRPAFRFCQLGPWLSFGSGKHHEFYAAVGVLLNVELGRGWVLTPSFGGGYYNASSGLDLGFDAEFRSGIELTKRFQNGQRLGINCAHLSNGSLSDKNPGTETLGVSYSIPLSILFNRSSTSANSAAAPLYDISY